MTYLYLAIAIVFEVGWAIAMKLFNASHKPGTAAAMVVMYVLSLVFLTLATRKLEIGVAYAIWAGTGAAMIAVAGITYFKEPASVLKLASIGLIVIGIVGLQLAGGHGAPAK